MFRIVYKQEFQQSTDNYEPYLELDRDPRFNMIDLTQLTKHKKSPQMAKAKKMEIDVDEYLNMKGKFKEIEL